MPSWLSQLRLKWFQATHALSFSQDLVEQVYKIQLNHSKVIHIRDGHPVYSLSAPALYSKPAAHFLARVLYRSIQNKNIPHLMSLAVTDVCNASCKHCCFYDAFEDPTREPLTLAQLKTLVREAQELGVSQINFVGGEPLNRPDLTDVIRSVDKNLSSTLMYTNGWNLSDRAPSLREAGLDSVYVSIDSADRKKHDTSRGSEGFFDRALKGIKAALRSGMSTGISCCLTPEAFRAGDFETLVEFARNHGVHEVIVFDAMPTGRMSDREDLIDDEAWLEELIQRSKRFNADLSYPGVLIHAHMTSHRSLGCSCGTSFFYVSPYGDVTSCDFNHRSFGNVLEEPLFKIWDTLTSNEAYHQSKWGGCKVKDSHFMSCKMDEDESVNLDAPEK